MLMDKGKQVLLIIVKDRPIAIKIQVCFVWFLAMPVMGSHLDFF